MYIRSLSSERRAIGRMVRSLSFTFASLSGEGAMGT